MRNESPRSDFEKAAASARQGSSRPVGEFLYFLRRTGKWWMTPLILSLLLLGLVIAVGGTAAAPFIYALF